MAGTVDVTTVGRWLREFAKVVRDNKELLTQLDSAIGDADHGVNMDRGMLAVVATLDGAPAADVATLLKQVGMSLVSTVGGASGPLYGTFFLRMATAAGEVDALSAPAFAKALRAGLEGVIARARPRRATRRCSTRWRPLSRRWTAPWRQANRWPRPCTTRRPPPRRGGMRPST